MPKISLHLGFTFRVGAADSNQYSRVDTTIAEIDTSLPIQPQIDESKAALNVIWPEIVKIVDIEMDKIQQMTATVEKK